LEDNTKIDLQEVGRGRFGLDLSGSGYGQEASACEFGNETSDSIK
jgi:hypothetical protein